MFTRIINSIAKAQQRRVAYWQLQNLTDKDLKDIGITRGEIKLMAYKV